MIGNANPVAWPFFNLSTPEPTGVIAVLAPQESSLLGLVSVVAPAGYGKTTLMRQWADAERSGAAGARRGVAWITLDASDNDPIVFMTYVATAIENTRFKEKTLRPLRPLAAACRGRPGDRGPLT